MVGLKLTIRLVLSWLKNNNEECSEKQTGVEQRMNMTILRPDFPTRPIVGAKRGHVSRERSWTPGVSSLDNALLRRIRAERRTLRRNECVDGGNRAREREQLARGGRRSRAATVFSRQEKKQTRLIWTLVGPKTSRLP